MAKYEIYYENMPRLERKLQTISHKCEKYGCSFQYRINSDIWKDCATEIEKELASVDFDAKRPENYERIKNVLEWINNYDSQCNNYMHNLKLVCGMEYIGYSDIGILASAFPAYAREMEKQRKREAEKSAESGSSYVGELKERITVSVKSFNAITSYFTDFGETTIYKIVDTANNVLIWKTSTSPKTDNVTKITGTVKSHKEYKGTKQTELTRCKVA